MNKRDDQTQNYVAHIRAKLVQLSHQARTPHLGSSLSCVDVMSILYKEYLQISPTQPDDPKRDRFILSKGHAATTLYCILAKEGFFPEKELDETYSCFDSRLPEHPSRNCVPGVEASTGSLGHGLSIGLGIALGNRIQGIDADTYVMLSDGECNEGSVWEAAMTASSWALSNLCAIIDLNKWQATGRSAEVLALEPIEKKFESFGWETLRIDGHDFEQIRRSLDAFKQVTNKPFAIIADTVKGKGISYMEDDNNWHYRIPTEEEVASSKKELGVR